MAYLDNSGLYIKYGTEATTPLTGGEYKNYGQLREIELRLDLSTYASGSNIIVNDSVFFPRGMRIQEVRVTVQTAATSGGAATLDVGLIATDRTTVTDATAFVAALPLASITPAGKEIILTAGSTNVGTLVGATTTTVNHPSVRVNAAVFTGGIVWIKLRYFRP